MYPKLIDIGPIPIHTYGLLLATALLVSISVAAALAESDGLSRKKTWDLGFIIIIGAIIGAKVLLVITSFDYYMADLSRLFSLDFLRAGGVYYGGLLGAMAGAYLFTRANPDMPFLIIADAAAVTIPLGQAIGRLGCFSAGCDYGTPSNLPWAVTFTSEYAREIVGVPLNVSLHPYQLYESFSAFGLFLLLLFLFKRRSFPGQILLLYLASYGVLRFFLEFFRGDVGRGFVFDGLLSTSQFISLLIVPLALGSLLYLRSRKIRE